MFPLKTLFISVLTALVFSVICVVNVSADSNDVLSIKAPEKAARGTQVSVDLSSGPEDDFVRVFSSVPITGTNVPEACRSTSQYMFSCPAGDYSLHLVMPFDKDVHGVSLIASTDVDGKPTYVQADVTVDEYYLSGSVLYNSEVRIADAQVTIQDNLGSVVTTSDSYGSYNTLVNSGDVSVTVTKTNQVDQSFSVVTAEDVKKFLTECLNPQESAKKCTKDMDINKDEVFDSSDQDILSRCAMGFLVNNCGQWEFSQSEITKTVYSSLDVVTYGHIAGDVTENWGSQPEFDMTSAPYILMTSGVFHVDAPFVFTILMVDDTGQLGSFSFNLNLGKFHLDKDKVKVLGADEFAAEIAEDTLHIMAFSYLPRIRFEVQIEISSEFIDEADLTLSRLVIGEGLSTSGDVSVSHIEVRDYRDFLFLPATIK